MGSFFIAVGKPSRVNSKPEASANMKATPIDYLLSTFLLTLLGTLAMALSSVFSAYLAQPFLLAYAPLATLFFFLLAFGLLSAVAARLVLRLWPLGEGLIAMTDRRFTVWKLYTVLYEFGCGALKPYTVMFLRPVVQALFGARIGKDIALGGKLVDPHLIQIGEGAIIGEGSVVTAHAINSGALYLAPVIVGARATIGVGAVIYPGVTIGEDATVTANAVVRSGTRIAVGELWGGVPAKCLREAGKTQ